MNEKSSLSIDLNRIIREKNPGLYRCLPGPLIHYLRGLIHEEEINGILQDFEALAGVDFIDSVLKRLEIGSAITGTEHVKPGGRYTFACNHPLGGIDGLILAAEITRNFGPTQLVVNDLLMHLEPLRDLFVPVNKHGKQKSVYAEQLNDLYASDRQVIYFPAGLCSRKKRGVIRDLPWKKNFVTKAIAYERDLVPVYVSGRNSDRFYRLAALRKNLGIKANLEMILLPDETFRQRGNTITITLGKPIPWQKLRETNSPRKWAQILQQQVETLKQNIPQIIDPKIGI